MSGFDRYPWIATAYLLTSTVSVPIFASLSDIHGRKPFFLLGATLFVVTSGLCGAAGTLTFLPSTAWASSFCFAVSRASAPAW